MRERLPKKGTKKLVIAGLDQAHGVLHVSKELLLSSAHQHSAKTKCSLKRRWPCIVKTSLGPFIVKNSNCRQAFRQIQD